MRPARLARDRMPDVWSSHACPCFADLSFQEGLYAEHLLGQVRSLQEKHGWPGWKSDEMASDFLNNRYMANTCRIAAGHLGSLLGQQRPAWNFTEHLLTPVGRQALWYICQDNSYVREIHVPANEVGEDDVPGLTRCLASCPSLKLLDLSSNALYRLSMEMTPLWKRLCDSLAANQTLTDLNLNNNRLQGTGVRMVSRALLTCSSLRRLGFSHNEPVMEPALVDLFRYHPSLVSVELVEDIERHLPSRMKDEIGRALLENKAGKLGFLHCDLFTLSETTDSLEWPEKASASDAVLLAGVLKTNTALTAFNLSPGATLSNSARSVLGKALLLNPGSRLSFCNDFGLSEGVHTCEFDLSRPELKDVEPFRLLAGCLRGNRTGPAPSHFTVSSRHHQQHPQIRATTTNTSTNTPARPCALQPPPLPHHHTPPPPPTTHHHAPPPPPNTHHPPHYSPTTHHPGVADVPPRTSHPPVVSLPVHSTRCITSMRTPLDVVPRIAPIVHASHSRCSPLLQ